MAAQEAKTKVYSEEEIKKIAPSYRGKPQNFDPAKVGKKRVPPQRQKSNIGPSSPNVVPPSALQDPAKITPQRNESIIAESIFGVDVHVTEIDPRQNFLANYAKLDDIAVETFDAYEPDVKQLDRTLAREEFQYYSTALLWMKLIDVKAKLGRQSLTSAEKDIRKATSDKAFNVPQPVFAYLSQIGNITDKMGKETEIEVPNLPVTSVQGLGGYHASNIDLQSHNLFEEVPSLGIAADVVMAVASSHESPTPSFKVGIPVGSQVTSNLVGWNGHIGIRRQEIRQRLESYGITATQFPEFTAHSRFHLKYIQSISDIVGKFETFRNEKVIFQNLTIAGGETQIIKTTPLSTEDYDRTWRERSVQPTSAACDSTAQIGAAYVFGFQLSKDQGLGPTTAERAANWSCLRSVPTSVTPWVMSEEWMDSRNNRRNLPDGIGTDRFRGLGKRQDVTLSDCVRRMIKTKR